MKKATLLVLFSLVFVFLIGSVCAADVNETVQENLSTSEVDDNVVELNNEDSQPLSASEVDGNVVELNNEDSQPLQDASFTKVTKTDFIRGNSFVVNLLDENGTGMPSKTVYFKVDGKLNKVQTDKNGAAKLRLDLTSEGIHKIHFYFNETGYNPASGYNKISYTYKHPTKIKGYNMKAFAGIRNKYQVTLTSKGVPLSKCKVIFTINKQSYVTKTNSKGVASVVVYLKEGKYIIKYKFKGADKFKAVRLHSFVTLKQLKNPYKTKYRTVIIDADGGFTKAFLRDVAKKLNLAGWNVIIKGIGPDQHSKNFRLAKDCVYMPIYNGLCAATIIEMTYDYYGGYIDDYGGVLTPAWFTGEWVSEKMSKFRNDITKFGYLKRAWDDNFSPSDFKGLNDPAGFMTDNGIRYCIGDTTYKIVEQFLYGGWVAHH